MTFTMYDGAFDSAQVPAMKAAGAIAASHYLTGMFAGTSAQPEAIRVAGLGVVLNWERAPGALVGATRAQGQGIAREALAAVPAGCPRNDTVGVYFSVDLAVTAGQLSSCDQGFAGLNDVLRPERLLVKVYAEGALIDHLVTAGLVQGKQWLSGSSSFPGYNPDSPNVCMVQQVGTDVPSTDRNIVTDPAALDAWWPDGSPYAKENDMSAADVAAINAHTDAAIKRVTDQAAVYYGDPAHPYSNRNLLLAVQNPTALAAAIVAKLPATGLTEAQIETALRAVFADAANGNTTATP